MPFLKDGDVADPFGNTDKAKAQDRPPMAAAPRFRSPSEEDAHAAADEISTARRKRQMAGSVPTTRLKDY